MRISGTVWLAFGTYVAIVTAIARILRRKAKARRVDVGSVSSQWVAEHRVESGNDVTR
jgi:hypothetical protein